MTQTTGIRRELEAARHTATGASLRSVDWNSIHWKSAHRTVRRLQRRIVQAQQQGKKRKVRALQFILTRSFHARCLAVRRVTENSGKRTPGVDGQLLNTPAKKAQAVVKLSTEDYQPQPLKRIYIPKANGELRPLGIPTMQDRAAQALHKLALDPIAETTADPNSYGFRKARSVADAIEQCCNALCRKTSAQWILEADIHSCFDEISHEWLLSNIPMNRAILRKWLAAGFLEQQVHHPTTAGTPQGGVISPVLMNLTLDGLEALLAERFPPRSGAKVNFVRYADDFIITGSSKELLVNEVTPLVAQFLKERGLQLSERKTKVTHVSEGFDFLGKHIRKYSNGKLLTKPSRPNVQAFLAEIKATCNENLHTSVENLLFLLNPKIRGWANSHRASAGAEIFRYVDYHIFREIQHWIRRRHPRKGKRWCYHKYFSEVGNNSYVFQATFERRGKLCTIRLQKAAEVKIKRHVKVKADANPYDPEWETYFEERLGLQMKENQPGYRKLLTIWFNQDGICPHCGEKITRETGWHLHHKVRVTDGGDETLANLTLLHPSCHDQLHAQTRKLKAAVAAPRPP